MPRQSKLFQLLSPDDLLEINKRLRAGESIKSVVRWIAGRGVVGVSVSMITRYAYSQELRERKEHRRCLIEKLLTPAHLAEYETLLRDRRTTFDAAYRWLLDHGYEVSPDACRQHFCRFDDKLKAVRHTAELAAAIAEVAREHGEVQIAEGLLARYEQTVLQRLMCTSMDAPLDPHELLEIGRAVGLAITTRETFEALRRTFEAEKRRAAEEAERLARRGASGPDVVARVREILGIEDDDDDQHDNRDREDDDVQKSREPERAGAPAP